MNVSFKQAVGLVVVYQIYKHRKNIKFVTDYAGSVLTEAMSGSSERVSRKLGADFADALFRHEKSDDSYDAWRASRHNHARRNT